MLSSALRTAPTVMLDELWTLNELSFGKGPAGQEGPEETLVAESLETPCAGGLEDNEGLESMDLLGKGVGNGAGRSWLSHRCHLCYCVGRNYNISGRGFAGL